MNIYLSDI